MVWYRHWLDARYRLIGMGILALVCAGIATRFGFIDLPGLMAQFLLLMTLGTGLSPKYPQYVSLTLPVARWKWVLSSFLVNYALLGVALVLNQAAMAILLGITGDTIPWSEMLGTAAARFALLLPFSAGAELVNLASDKTWVTALGALGLLAPLAALSPIGAELVVPTPWLAATATCVLLLFAVIAAQRREYT